MESLTTSPWTTEADAAKEQELLLYRSVSEFSKLVIITNN